MGDKMSGLFITFEGSDGTGKSTQAALLANLLKNKGFEVICTREPGGNQISEKIREIIISKENDKMNKMTEALLYAAARAQLVNEVIAPMLMEGNVVVCERFLDSSVVYQGYARGIGENIINDINKYAVNGIVPDITFLLTLPPDIGINRKKNQQELDRIESSELNFHKRVFKGYMALAEQNKDRIKVIDANRDIDEIACEIADYIEKLIKERSFKNGFKNFRS